MNAKVQPTTEPESPPSDTFATAATRRATLLRALVVIAGLVLPQVFLYWPSLLGQQLLLPLDNLSRPRMYVPLAPEQRAVDPRDYQNLLLDDLILSIEFRRQYAVERVRQGELPLWTPYLFCGAPFLAANNTAVFSPFRVIDYLLDSPVSHAWAHLAKVLWMGVGAYLFFRRTLDATFWAAAIGSWSFPLATYFVFWQGYPPSYTASWLPWLLLANWAIVARPSGWGGIGLALATAGLLVSGHAGSATHVLIVSGLYSLACVGRRFAWGGLISRPAMAALVVTITGWSVGFLVASPQNLTTIDYLRISQRVERRDSGLVEHPPVGVRVLPQFALPYIYGSSLGASRFLDREQANWFESAAQASCGVLLTLVFAPLAWANSRRTYELVFWMFIAAFASSHILKIPLLVQVLHIPPLHLLQNNRFVFVTAWAVITLAVIGLDTLFRGEYRPSAWFAFPLGLVVLLGAYCIYLWIIPHETIRHVQESANSPLTEAFASALWHHFQGIYTWSFGICLIAASMWIAIWTRWIAPGWLPVVVTVLVLGELLWNAAGINAQCDRELYYPELPALRAIAEGPSGRITGVNCLPPNLGISHRLRHVRGYDGAYPSRIFDLFSIAQREGKELSADTHPHALMGMTPAEESAVLDMLNLKYRIHRGYPPSDVEPWHQSLDYWVTLSETSLPRSYVPQRVEVVPESRQRLERLAADDFDPREVAFVEAPLAQPIENARGTVEMIVDEPERVVIEAQMETPGLVVLADLWYIAWKAYVNGQPVPIHRANHALRGIEVPAGHSTIEFRFDSDHLRLGFQLSALAAVILTGWAACVVGLGRRRASGSIR